MTATPDAATMLRHARLRATRPRLAVIDELRRVPHVSADQVSAAVRERHGSVSRQAIYDVLAALCAAGLVRRIEPAGSPALYELTTGDPAHDNHHHLVCRRCGAVADTDCLRGKVPCLAPAATHGYVVDEAEIVFWGLCPACVAADPAASAAEADPPDPSDPPEPSTDLVTEPR